MRQGWTGGSGEANPTFRRLAKLVVERMDQYRVPGVAIGVLHHDEINLAGFGITNVDHPLAVNPDTLFQIGSISKTVCGTAAMRLVDAGKLDLDAPVRAYLPDFRLADEDVAERVTLRHIFTHTGGWLGDYFEHTGSGEDALARVTAKLANVPQLTPLGTLFSYSNSGFYVAGRVIEVVTGQSYERALRDLVLRPLGMSMSFFRHFATEFITYRVAVGHTLDRGQLKVVRPWSRTRSAAPSGGIVSTIRDILRYARFHLGDGTTPSGDRLLSPGLLATMRAPRVATDSNGSSVGVTWMLGVVGGVRIVRHGGSTFGQRASLTLAPDRDFTVAVLTNAETGEALHRDVTRWALQNYLDALDDEPTVLPLDSVGVDPYLGQYRGALGTLAVSREDGSLILTGIPLNGDPPGRSIRVGFVTPDRMVALDTMESGRRAEFVRDPEGEIRWLRWGGRLHRRAERLLGLSENGETSEIDPEVSRDHPV